MPKALTFKGDKPKPKKRKRTQEQKDAAEHGSANQLATSGELAAEAEHDENWVSVDAVSDLAGPVMVVFPSEPVMTLACDQLGTVFASKVENMVEGVASSAEPHDVRQVFVATRVVGSETDVVLKGCNGRYVLEQLLPTYAKPRSLTTTISNRYLGCDSIGTLSTTREAISPEETFKCQPSDTQPGLFTLRSMRNTYLSIDTSSTPPAIRGDADEISTATEVRLRMQARFKPKNKDEKAEKVRAKISRKELEEQAGRRLDDDEVKMLKKARREGDFHEAMLDIKVKGSHDKFS